MPEITIKEIHFLPAVAIARLGASPIPLEAFSWDEDPNFFGAGQTTIIPQVSLRVLPDGSIKPYLPRRLQFKDDGKMRPVCPFLELHASWCENETEEHEDGPLTPGLLHRAGLKMAALSFKVVAGNRKAAFRTGDAACAFEARGLFSGTNYQPHGLMAYSRNSTGVPLVSQDRPISLGSFQVIRPGPTGLKALGVCLDTIRIRFTPAKGDVYGPPFAIKGQTDGSRTPHEIVPLQNRILNPEASWPKYSLEGNTDPVSQPADTYDGDSDIDRSPQSWGVVDDTCDVLITATLASQSIEASVKGQTGIPATARILVGPPHFAPDRRPFYSMVDELADRDPDSVRSPDGPKDKKQLTRQDRQHSRKRSDHLLRDAVFDLFRRILETASLVNVERQLDRAVGANAGANYHDEKGFPTVGKNTMTLEDKVGGLCFLSVVGQDALKKNAGQNFYGDIVLARSELARAQHQELADPEYLIWFLLQNETRFRQIVRPPFAPVSTLKTEPTTHSARSLTGLRDPRIPRDRAHDMRMPPYMRDSDYSALSITLRQWQQIKDFIALIKEDNGAELSPVRIKVRTYHQRKKGQ